MGFGKLQLACCEGCPDPTYPDIVYRNDSYFTTAQTEPAVFNAYIAETYADYPNDGLQYPPTRATNPSLFANCSVGAGGAVAAIRWVEGSYGSPSLQLLGYELAVLQGDDSTGLGAGLVATGYFMQPFATLRAQLVFDPETGVITKNYFADDVLFATYDSDVEYDWGCGTGAAHQWRAYPAPFSEDKRCSNMVGRIQAE